MCIPMLEIINMKVSYIGSFVSAVQKMMNSD